MSPVEPALTAREWERASEHAVADVLYWAHAAQIEAERPKALHRIAALALNAGQCGFGWHHIFLLRGLVNRLAGEIEGDRLAYLADRIEALLPPLVVIHPDDWEVTSEAGE